MDRVSGIGFLLPEIIARNGLSTSEQVFSSFFCQYFAFLYDFHSGVYRRHCETLKNHTFFCQPDCPKSFFMQFTLSLQFTFTHNLLQYLYDFSKFRSVFGTLYYEKSYKKAKHWQK